MASNQSRIEHDFLGDREVPVEAYYGVQTLRGSENFPITHLPLAPALILASATTRREFIQLSAATYSAFMLGGCSGNPSDPNSPRLPSLGGAPDSHDGRVVAGFPISGECSS